MSLFSASCSCCLVAPSCKHIRPPERTLRHSAGLNLPAKTPSRPFSIPRQVSLFYLLQLLFGGSKLQASGLQNGPLATAKQHLIACRNRVQTYPEKLPNVPSEFLEKMSLFSASCSCCLVAPSCKHIRPPERTLRHSAGLNLPAKIPSRPFSIPRQVSLFYLQLLFGGSKLQASGLQNGPFATAKQHLIACRNVVQAYPQKLPNVPSEFQEKMSFVCLLQLLFGGSKLQAWSL